MAFSSPRSPFLFFAGIDGVAPVVGHARRDQQLRTQHRTRYWRDDFSNTRRLNLDTLRWGPNWYLAHPEPERFDWSHVDDRLAYARQIDLDIWYVLQHKQVPEWTEILDPGFPAALRRYGEAVARRYPHLGTYCISVEPEFYALIACSWGQWQPHRTDAFEAALDNFAAAISETAEAIRRINPEAQIVHTDFAPGVTLAKMVAPYVDLMALDYYPCHHEHFIDGWIDLWWHSLHKPLVIGETGLAGGYCDHDLGAQQQWLRDTLRACRAMIERGVDLRGYCPYPTVVDNRGWGSNLVFEYGDHYPPGIDCFEGDNAGSMFRLEAGTLRRVPVPELIETFQAEMQLWRRWEAGEEVANDVAVAAA